jgi:hypothetical protein
MKLQEQMFGLIRDWYSSKLFKKDFLADKNITQGKFDYCLKKYPSDRSDSNDSSPVRADENFKQVVLASVKEADSETSLSIKILVLRTASGWKIKVFEKC